MFTITIRTLVLLLMCSISAKAQNAELQKHQHNQHKVLKRILVGTAIVAIGVSIKLLTEHPANNTTVNTFNIPSPPAGVHTI